MRIESVYEMMSRLLKKGRAERDVPMKEHTSFKAGGRAALFAEPGSTEELKDVLRLLSSEDIPYYILGNGTNVLVRDGGFPGAIVHIGPALSQVTVSGDRITAECGALLSSVAAKALLYGLTGFEFAAGIPGSIGGAAFMNAGAYDGEMKQVVEEVRVLSRDGQREYVLSGQEMEYGYRRSILTLREDVAVSVTLKLKQGEEEAIRQRMRDLAERRSSKQPLQFPSAGSFFKRPPGHFAGGLIESAGLKGLSLGGARVSPLHAGFIINEGNATAADIISLMEVVRNVVYDQSGVLLEPEVRIIGQD